MLLFHFTLVSGVYDILKRESYHWLLCPKNHTPSTQAIGPDYLGGVVGNWYQYTVSGWLYGNGTSKDSIFALSNQTLPRCSAITLPIAFRVEHLVADSVPSGRYDTTYLFVRNDTFADYGGQLIYAIGKTSWITLDTCIVKNDTPFVIQSIDGDNIPDTARIRYQTGTLTLQNGDTFYTSSPIGWKITITNKNQYPIDSVIETDKWKFKIVRYKGLWRIADDSLRQVYYAFGSPNPALDTTYKNTFIKTLTNTSYVPQTLILTDGIYIKGQKLFINYEGNKNIIIFNTNGEIVKNIRTTEKVIDISSLRGAYLIRINTNKGISFLKFVN
jgi:hypothetical protein